MTRGQSFTRWLAGHTDLSLTVKDNECMVAELKYGNSIQVIDHYIQNREKIFIFLKYAVMQPRHLENVERKESKQKHEHSS